ncbi:hypothetical protein LWI29_009633 [Acer saccharum]|uniref:Uncharacterized protein n=1 Tax=Acer saccharum TaxID=4024 RepID=A0AA39RU48_ACESA|nr:hypothetical protein LWI29_009633 [Acer saccharum]
MCLSDSATRRAFNLKRWKVFCIECNKIPYTNCKLSPIQPTHSSKHKAWKPVNWPSNSYKFLRNLRDIKERFKEEARVIENCLSSTTTTTTASSRQEPSLMNPSENLFRSNTLSKTRKESPIFDPSDYIFQGYPHLRNRINGKPEDCWYLEAKKNKHKKAKTEENLGFPGHEKVEFGDVVKAPPSPKLVTLPKGFKTVALQERLRLQAVEAYRSRKGWTTRPGVMLPPVTTSPSL